MEANSMTQGILGLIQHIEDIITSASRMPLLGKSLVDPEELLEVLEKIRVALPDEVHEAQWVVNEKERIFAEANEEARRIRREAQDYVNSLVADHRLVLEAEKQAAYIINEAQKEAQNMVAESSQYADRMLGQLEQSLQRAIEVVRSSRQEMAATAHRDED
jgi:vacuolar-type H+-ATPase subunit H